MNRMFYLFIMAVMLGAIGGFYYHEALNEKVIYERNQCYSMIDVQNQGISGFVIPERRLIIPDSIFYWWDINGTEK